MSEAYERDIGLIQKELEEHWEIRAPNRVAKACVRAHPHYPREGTTEEAAFLNGANHILGIVQRRSRKIRLAFTVEEAEQVNMQALNLETVVLQEMIDEYNGKYGGQS